jgi:hypothetical protein
MRDTRLKWKLVERGMGEWGRKGKQLYFKARFVSMRLFLRSKCGNNLQCESCSSVGFKANDRNRNFFLDSATVISYNYGMLIKLRGYK